MYIWQHVYLLPNENAKYCLNKSLHQNRNSGSLTTYVNFFNSCRSIKKIHNCYINTMLKLENRCFKKTILLLHFDGICMYNSYHPT